MINVKGKNIVERVMRTSGALQCWLGHSGEGSLNEIRRGEGSQACEHLWEEHYRKRGNSRCKGLRQEYAWCILGIAQRPQRESVDWKVTDRGGLEYAGNM